METTTSQSQVDLASLRSNYCEFILENMEVQYVYQYAYDCLEDDYRTYSLNELKEEIENERGKEVLNDLIVKSSY